MRRQPTCHSRLVAEWVTDHADELSTFGRRATHGEQDDHVVRLRFADGVEKSLDLNRLFALE